MSAIRLPLLTGLALALALSFAPATASASSPALRSPLLQGRVATGSWSLAARKGPRLRLEGAAGDVNVNQVVPLILGIIPGFGLGHLVAGDQDGFVFWLVVDLVVVTVASVLGAVLSPPGAIFGSLAGVAWLVLHVVQGLDAYAAAGGPDMLSRGPTPVEADPLARWQSGWVPLTRISFGAVD